LSSNVEHDGIVVHHSLTNDGTVKDWPAIRRYHMQENGWADIGYHYGVEETPDGVAIMAGRRLGTLGAHTKGHNSMIGICVAGNYDLGPAPEDHLHALVHLVLALLGEYTSMTPDDIHRHSEYAQKSCPGKLFQWDEFMKRVRAGWKGRA